MDSAQIRPAAAADYPAVVALLQQYDLPLDGVEAHLAHFLVAVRPDGSLSGVIGLEPYGGMFGLLRSVAVVEQHTGLGRVLVEQMIAQAARTGIRQLILLTTTAPAYFPRFGFRTIQREDVPEAVKESVEFQSACPDTAVVMALDLEEVTA